MADGQGVRGWGERVGEFLSSLLRDFGFLVDDHLGH